MLRNPAFLATAALAALFVAAATPASAENIDPDDDGSRYAYGENVGWLNARPLGAGGPGIEVTDDALTGWMWGENIGWVSLSCTNTASCATTAYGVTNDGNGILGGYAWSENAGWLNFSCRNTDVCRSLDYGVVIDPQTGDFSGRAWGENIGWVTFSDTGAVTYKVKTGWTGCAGANGTPMVTAGPFLLLWESVDGATIYDVVRGRIGALQESLGDFKTATAACVVNDTPELFAPLEGEPLPGDGFWYLARPADCGGGTYDSLAPTQVAPRDEGIANSGNDCPR